MTTTAAPAPSCPHCGGWPHQGVCPMVQAVEYHPDGTIKRVEYKTSKDYDSTNTTWPIPYVTVGMSENGIG